MHVTIDVYFKMSFLHDLLLCSINKINTLKANNHNSNVS